MPHKFLLLKRKLYVYLSSNDTVLIFRLGILASQLSLLNSTIKMELMR